MYLFRLVLIIVLLVLLRRLWRHWQMKNGEGYKHIFQRRAAPKSAKEKSRSASATVGTLQECKVCGAYVANESKPCERVGCPQAKQA